MSHFRPAKRYKRRRWPSGFQPAFTIELSPYYGTDRLDFISFDADGFTLSIGPDIPAVAVLQGDDVTVVPVDPATRTATFRYPTE